jgi:hypothetical protein
MAYHRKRAQHLCFFLINPEVATWSRVVFTDTNAASITNQLRGEGLAGLDNIKFDVMRSIPRPGDREGWLRPVQAEVLVPDSIPLAYVSEIVFVSNASMNYGQYLCKSLVHPPFSVKAQMFTDSPRAPQTAINFAYVKELLLAGPKAGLNMVYLEKNKYSMTVDDYVKVIADVNALSGTKGIFSLYSISSREENAIGVREFPRQDGHRHTCNIPLNKLLLIIRVTAER